MLQTITLSPTFESVAGASAFLEDSLNTWGVDRKVQIKLLITLDEMLSNVIKYSGATSVTIGCEHTGDMILLRLADDGAPFDPLSAGNIDPNLPLEDRGEGGMGIFLVKSTIDHLEYQYREGKNCLTLGCRISPLCEKEAIL